MRRSRIAFGSIIAVALIGWLLFSSAPLQQQQNNTPALTAQGGVASVAPAASPLSAPTERSTLADALNAPMSTIQADLRLVSEIIDTFRTNFPQSGNPTGTNADITAALTGRNRLKLALIPPDHPAINRDGELLDRWGTPFFFHSESATRTEIRSAGPDKKLWTEDDVAFAPLGKVKAQWVGLALRAGLSSSNRSPLHIKIELTRKPSPFLTRRTGLTTNP